MTFEQYSNLRDYIIREYDYIGYRKANASVYGLEWTAEDEAEYQKWCASRKRITDWAINIIKQEVAKHDYENFKEWVMEE